MSLYSNFCKHIFFLDFLNIKNTELNYHFLVEIKGRCVRNNEILRPGWIANEKRQSSPKTGLCISGNGNNDKHIAYILFWHLNLLVLNKVKKNCSIVTGFGTSMATTS